MDRSTVRSLVCIFVVAAVPTGAAAQESPEHIGISAYLGHNGPWTLGENRIPGTTSFGLLATIPLVPAVVARFGYELNLYGSELSGWAAARLGGALRLPLDGGPVQFEIPVGLASVVHSGGERFPAASAGLGLRLVLGHLTLGAELGIQRSLSSTARDGERRDPITFHPAHWRVRLGIRF